MRTNIFWPCSSEVVGTNRRMIARNLLWEGSTASFFENNNLPAVYSKNAPKMNSIHSKRVINAMPAKMNAARSTSAPNTPQNSTRRWYSGGTRKYVRISAQTKTLSIDRLYSMRYPENHS